MPEVNWTDDKGYHNRVFGIATRASAFFLRLPMECVGKLQSGTLWIGRKQVDRWYVHNNQLQRESVNGKQPAKSIVRVVGEHAAGTVVVPVRTYPPGLSDERIRENLKQYPIDGLDASQLEKGGGS